MLNTNLWKSISEFQFDDPNSSFAFSDRLARENGWTKEFSLNVILEYKRFIYLCCVSNGPVTPSDEVDQVWHLHMTYTVSYWEEFCDKTLKRKIHHNPTKGGNQEKAKFKNLYANTKTLYKQEFGIEQPISIWPVAKTRFRKIHFQRVNMHDNFIVRKPSIKWRYTMSSVGIFLIALLFIQAQDNYIGFFGVAVILIIIVANFLNKNGSNRGGNGGSGCSFDDGGHGCSSCSGCGGCGGCGGD